MKFLDVSLMQWNRLCKEGGILIVSIEGFFISCAWNNDLPHTSFQAINATRNDVLGFFEQHWKCWDFSVEQKTLHTLLNPVSANSQLRCTKFQRIFPIWINNKTCYRTATLRLRLGRFLPFPKSYDLSYVIAQLVIIKSAIFCL